jgi:hypothetical protein
LGVPVLSRPLALGLAILVAVVWATSIAAALVFPDRYEIDTEINAIFAIVVGAVFGLTPKRDQVGNARRALGRRRIGGSPVNGGEADEDADPPRGDDR